MPTEHARDAESTQRPGVPAGVKVLAILMILVGVTFIAGGIASFFMSTRLVAVGDQGNAGLTALLAGTSAAVGVILLVFGALHGILAIGLLQRRNPARVLTIILFGLSGVGACIGTIVASLRFSREALLWNLALICVDVLVLSYLFRPQTKRAFNA